MAEKRSRLWPGRTDDAAGCAPRKSVRARSLGARAGAPRCARVVPVPALIPPRRMCQTAFFVREMSAADRREPRNHWSEAEHAARKLRRAWRRTAAGNWAAMARAGAAPPPRCTRLTWFEVLPSASCTTRTHDVPRTPTESRAPGKEPGDDAFAHRGRTLRMFTHKTHSTCAPARRRRRVAGAHPSTTASVTAPSARWRQARQRAGTPRWRRPRPQERGRGAGLEDAGVSRRR